MIVTLISLLLIIILLEGGAESKHKTNPLYVDVQGANLCSIPNRHLVHNLGAKIIGESCPIHHIYHPIGEDYMRSILESCHSCEALWATCNNKRGEKSYDVLGMKPLWLS